MKGGAATMTTHALGQLLSIRQLATVHIPNYDFSTVDRFLARVKLALELGHGWEVGPPIPHATVVVLDVEYSALVEVASCAKLHAIPAGFDRHLYVRTMTQLCAAVGRNVAIEWGIS